MTFGSLVRTVIIAGSIVLVAVLFQVPVLGLSAAGIWLIGNMAWSVHKTNQFKTWTNRPLVSPDDKLGDYYHCARAIHASLIAVRTRSLTLVETAQKHKNIANNLPDAWVILNDRMMIEGVNRSADSLLGLTSKDAGHAISALIRHPEAQPLLQPQLNQGISSVDIPSPTNEQVQLELRLIQVGEDQRFLIARDVTELNRLLAMRQDFIANVSHELRTPLTVLIGYIESFFDSDLDRDTLLEIIHRLVTPAQRMKSLVDDLLTLTRLETSPGPDANSITPINGNTLIKTVVEEAEPLIKTDHKLVVESQDDVQIHGVLDELRSAFLNLMTNAIRYSPDGGNVTLRWSKIGTHARFEVEDEGVGIPPEHIPRITERFYRVDPKHSRMSGGTGLGLAIVKHVLRRHNSTLEISSKPGIGSTFYCDIPLNSFQEEAIS